MPKSQLITLVAVALFVPACASSPTAKGFSTTRPASIDCRRVAPTGTKLKTKTVCGPTGGGQSDHARERYERNRDPWDVLGTGRINDP